MRAQMNTTRQIIYNMKYEKNIIAPLIIILFVRTHAHSLGSVISGYAFNEKSNEYRQIAKGSPQWPQAFYPMKQLQTVKPGEYLAARCTYNSTTRDKAGLQDKRIAREKNPPLHSRKVTLQKC